MSLPAPLVPAEVDLRDFAFMPLDVDRLRDSDFAAKTKPEGFRSGLLLWCAAWHQVPAGSLPVDEEVLAKLAGFGFAVREWARVRDDALRGWILCNDDRIYHPVIAEKALDAWQGKLRQRWKTAMAAAKKHCERIEVAFRQMPFETWIELGRPELADLYRHWDKRPPSPGQEASVTGTGRGPSPGQDPSVPRLSPENSIQGRGRGTGTDLKALPQSSSVLDSPLPTTRLEPQVDSIHARACEITALLRRRGGGVTASDPRVRAWAANPAATDAQLLAALDAAKLAREKSRDPTSINAGYLDTILGNQIAGNPTIDFEALAKV